MKNISYIQFSLVILVFFIIIFFLWQVVGYKVSEPKYQVIKSEGAIEVRLYPALIFAQTQIDGERYFSINTGFRILADYIFGNNFNEKKIAMTAPVIQQRVKISMTTPAFQQQNGDKWDIRFVMPAEFTLKTLPKPNNKNITLLEIPARKYIVIRFSGANSEENLKYHLAILIDYILQHQLEKIGEPIYAFYNPPWILPFLRRNEIMIEIN